MLKNIVGAFKTVVQETVKTFIDLDLAVKVLLVVGTVSSPFIMVGAIALIVVAGVVQKLKGE